MRFADVLRDLEERDERRIVPGLERIRAVAELMGDPHLTYPTVHVAGTNGKTTTARAFAASEVRLDQDRAALVAAQTDPRIVLDGEYPRLLDEYQLVDGLWEAVRGRIDDLGKRGLFLLTGSAAPDEDGVLHTGARRIAPVRMRTMSFLERGLSSGEVSVGSLLDGHSAPTRPRGIAVAEEPLLEPLRTDPERARLARSRSAQYFNAHPFLSGAAVGALARAELDGEPGERILRMRTALSGPLGALGAHGRNRHASLFGIIKDAAHARVAGSSGTFRYDPIVLSEFRHSRRNRWLLPAQAGRCG